MELCLATGGRRHWAGLAEDQPVSRRPVSRTARQQGRRRPSSRNRSLGSGINRLAADGGRLGRPGKGSTVKRMRGKSRCKLTAQSPQGENQKGLKQPRLLQLRSFKFH